MSGPGRGKGHGTGSPISFKCHRERIGYARLAQGGHMVRRTGRFRPYHPPRFSARGARSLLEAHEYRCTCGHVGWSAHVDILRAPPEIGPDA